MEFTDAGEELRSMYPLTRTQHRLLSVAEKIEIDSIVARWPAKTQRYWYACDSPVCMRCHAPAEPARAPDDRDYAYVGFHPCLCGSVTLTDKNGRTW